MTIHAGPADSTDAVERFMAQVAHPLKAEVETLRTLVMGVDPGVREGIKWNSPSFRTSEYFATVNLRFRGGIALILHLGARARGQDVRIDDPCGLLTWHGPERASLPVHAATDLHDNAPTIRAILQQWIAWV